MSLNPYLNFDGDCRAAFDYYRGVFGGEYAAIMNFDEGPDDFEVAEEDKGKVMHVSLPIGDSVLMGSDVPAAHAATSLILGSNVQISHAPDSRDDADAKFAKLSDGGTVIMPMQDQFWGSYFGTCIDKFGVHWMLNLPT